MADRTASRGIDAFTASFKGNGHVVSNLFIDRPGGRNVGFISLAASRIEDLRLRNVNVAGGSYVGALAGVGNPGSSVVGSWATGVVKGRTSVGGLVGVSSGLVAGSFASVAASGPERVGGLVGEMLGGLGGGVVASYARGFVTAVRDAGGLVGRASGSPVVRASYSTATVAGRATAGGLVGGGRPAQATASYWDLAASGREPSARAARASPPPGCGRRPATPTPSRTGTWTSTATASPTTPGTSAPASSTPSSSIAASTPTPSSPCRSCPRPPS